MDNLMQNREDMQEEELYALLDKAFDAKRLCVSEELIQKTLQRVAEAEDSKVISFEKAAKRKLPAVKYVSVAAAALFVAVLGVGVVRGGVSSKDVQMEATYENASGKAESLLADAVDGRGLSVADSKNGSTQYYYSTNDVGDMSDDTAESETTAKEDRDVPMPKEECVSFLEGTVTVISADLAEALTAVGAEPVAQEVEYWEFVQRETTWEKDLFRELAAAMDVFGERLPENGTYEYCLVCKDGSRQTVFGEYPLDGIVRIETKKGTLWGLLGETVRFYSE